MPPKPKENNPIWGKWIFRCFFCSRIFNTSQGLAGHQKLHRMDPRWQKRLCHPRVKIPLNHPLFPSSSLDLTLGPPQQAARDNPTGYKYYQLFPMPVKNGKGKWDLNFGVVHEEDSEDSSERTVTDPNIRGIARGIEDGVEVNSKKWVELDLELKL